MFELAQAGSICRLDPQLDYDEQELRHIYLGPRAVEFLGEELPGLSSFFETETNPHQDFDAFVSQFASGLPIEIGTQFKAFQRKCLHALEGGVWYIKTPDLRIFGWFPVKDCFVAVVSDAFENVKKYNLYEGYRQEVIRFRSSLNLDEPKFIPGDDPHAVISNYTLPD